jgi:hypothetical protein
MSRQYFMDMPVDPPTLNPNASALVSTSEEALWPAPIWSPIPIGDCRPGKSYRVSAGGIMTTSSSASTLILTPRIGVSVAAGITMGANAAATVTASLTGVPWFLEFTTVIRTIGVGGAANSTAIGNGFFTRAGVTVAFGGTSATFEADIAMGIVIGKTLSVAGSVTPEWVAFQPLN